MSNIYDESQEMMSANYIAEMLLDSYGEKMIRSSPMDVDERLRISKLANNWQGTDLMAQIILDSAKLLAEYGIKPEDLRW